jgi:hypothetical protein
VYGLAAETGLSASPGDAIVLRLRFSAPEGSPANSGALARIEIASAQVKRGGERFAIRYVRNDVDNRSQAVDI